MLRFIFSEAKSSTKGPAIFIDRDGVINQRKPGSYVLDWSQFVFMPDIRKSLKQLASLQRPMIVISNQAAIGKGLLDADGLEAINAGMIQALQADGTTIAAAYYCPHTPSDNCICRKPKPAMFFKAAEDFNIDLAQSIFIGDSESDVRAARATGCKPILLGEGLQNFSDSKDWSKDVSTSPTANELFDVAAKCLAGHA